MGKVEEAAESGDLHVEHVSRTVAQRIQQARAVREKRSDLCCCCCCRHSFASIITTSILKTSKQAKAWTQKELAQKINELPRVVNDYEAGRGIPNTAILGKMEKVLGVKLRGKLT
jgi:hypothetical protein